MSEETIPEPEQRRSTMVGRVLEPPPPTVREPAIGLEPEQLLMRRTGIGGSEIAVLAGLSRWTTPIAIFESKVLDVKKEPTLPMQLGNLFEEPIATLYRIRKSKQTARCATLRHPDKEFGFAIVTPDRAVYSSTPPRGEVMDQGPEPLLSLRQVQEAECLFQAKSTTWRLADEWGHEDTDEVPPEYLAAEVWGMGITGLRRSDFGVLIDKDKFKTYTVLFDQQLWEDLYILAERFMVEHVLTGIPPTPDASKAHAAFISRLFPKEEGSRTKLDQCPPELLDTLRRYAQLHGAQKTLNAAVALYKQRIQTIIGTGSGFYMPFGTVTWLKDRDSEGVNWRNACAEARTIAQLMLMKFGDQLEAPEREELVRQLRALETTHKCVTRKGARKLRLKLDDAMQRELAPQTRGLHLSLADGPAIDVGQIIEAVDVRQAEDAEDAE